MEKQNTEQEGSDKLPFTKTLSKKESDKTFDKRIAANVTKAKNLADKLPDHGFGGKKEK